MVEFLREVTQGRSTAGLHIVKDGLHEIGGLVGAHLSARHSLQHFSSGQLLATQVNDSHIVFFAHNAHGNNVMSRERPRVSSSAA